MASYELNSLEVGVQVLVGYELFFPSPWHPDWLRGSSPGLKRLGHVADHSPPSSAEVKNKWIYTSTPLYAFMA
jgi:hypothetical protein